MSLFTIDDRVLASEHANKLLKAWENTLALRISLQKVIEIVNKLPAYDFSEVIGESQIRHEIKNTLTSLYSVLSKSCGLENNIEMSNIDSVEGLWNNIDGLNVHMREVWRSVLNKWHTRLQFGSKDSGYKMKTFKQTFWDQVRYLSL